MSTRPPFRVPAPRQLSGFSFIEVLLVLGIVGMMALCLIGFLLSRAGEPLKILPPKPAPAAATPTP